MYWSMTIVYYKLERDNIKVMATQDQVLKQEAPAHSLVHVLSADLTIN